MSRFVMCSLMCLMLASCNLLEPEAPSIEEAGDDVDSSTTGSTSINLAIRSITYNSGTPGPVFTAIDTTVPRDSDVQVLLNGAIVSEFEVPCKILPAFTDCTSSISKKISLVVADSGVQTFEVTALKGALWRTESFTKQINQAACASNESVYTDKMQPILKTSCESCHGNGNAGVFQAQDSWSTIKTILVNRGDNFYKFPSGENPGHDARPFSPNGGTYRLFAEMVWRAENNFTCL